MGVTGHGTMTRRARPAISVAAMAVLLLGAAAPPPPTPAPRPVADAVRPATPNPPIDDSCGVDVTLVLDASGSIRSAGAVDSVRNAATAFLTALADTNSTARVIDFGSNARQTAPRTNVTTASISATGVLGQALALYYNPIPPYPTGVSGHAYRGGGRNVFLESSYTNGSSIEYTNWDDALNETATSPPELVVFLTDGAPTAVVADQAGDPFFRAGDTTPDVLYGLDGNQQADDFTLDRAVQEANRLKTDQARILAVGVGDAFGAGSTDNVDRLKAVTNGPTSNVVTSASGITDLNNVDVALVQDFNALAQALRLVVTQLCSPSLTIQKLAQTRDSAAYVPTPGWTMTVNPVVNLPGNPPYRWILPTANAPIGPKSAITNANGFAQFQWEPNPPTRTSTATVTETNQSGYTPRDWACKAKNPDGSVVETSGAFPAAAPFTFTVTVGPQQIVTCTVRNDFNYAPAGVVTKVNTPTIVRGDGNGTNVTSHYTVTNTGNTPLSPVSGTDTECAPIEYVMAGGEISGDDNGDGLLDPGETWDLQCTRRIQHATTDEDVLIPNTVTLHGRAPNGQDVIGTADAEVQVLTPDIHVEKTVAPTAGVAPLDVTYTYTVTTTGNTPLANVQLDDDTPPCSTAANRTFVGGDTANTGYLDPGETWTYTCDANNLTDSVVNVATVVAQPVTPVDPLTGDPGLTPIGDTVTDDDDAEVTVETADLQLVKTAVPPIGFVGTQITYTFAVTNPATTTATLVPQGGRNGVVDDTQCTPVTYQSGDTGDDSRMDPGETWIYTCTRTYPNPGFKRNEATATMVVDGIGTVLTRTDPALVLIVAPAVHLEKTATDAPVYDGDSVTYTYQATNPSIVPLQDVTVTDDAGPGTCTPVTFVSGDTDNDDLLDPGELWEYTCTTTVSKSAPSNTPEVIENTATVTGTPNVAGTIGAAVSDDDTAEVTVIDPSISIVKSVAPTEVRLPGGAVTWTATVTNTGDTPLFNLVVSDDTCSPMEYQSGDTGNDEISDPGEVWVYTCEGEVSEDTTNSADVVAGDILGGDVTDLDTADVTTFDASIALVKVPSDELVPTGTSVTYTYTATNTGTDPLTDVTLDDDTCSPISAPSGDTGGDGVMDPGEVWTYTCDNPIDVETTNQATVTGTDHVGGTVDAFALATVTPYESGIHVEKTADPTILYGPGPVTYTYAVTNTGNVPLANVAQQITDDTCAPLVYVRGDDDANDLLTGIDDLFETGPPETWIFTCTMTISQDTTNTVIATGTPVHPDNDPETEDPVLGQDVSDQDTAAVQVLPPGSITIVKRLSSGADGSFDFTGDLGAFTLTTSGGSVSQTFPDIQPGRYDVTEVDTDDWSLAQISCDDPGDNSGQDGATAVIRVDGSEDVTCTFTNTPTPPTSAVDAVGRAVGKAVGAVDKLLPAPIRGPLGMGLTAISFAAAVVAGLLGLAYLRNRGRRAQVRHPRDQATRIRR